MKHILWIFVIAVSVIACSKKVALDKDQFTALLIDMHTTDGVLEVINPNRRAEKDNYMYYNDLFKKYGITREDFDSCLTYYTKDALTFNKIYGAVIDTLSRRQTQKMRVLSQFTKNDTINLFQGYTMIVADTIRADSTIAKAPKKDSVFYAERVVTDDTVYFDKRNQFVLVEVDSLVPGMYHFFTSVKLDRRVLGRRAYIKSFFLSEDNDTLKVPDQYVRLHDTIRVQEYKWEYYVKDTMYNKMVVKIVYSEMDKKAKVQTKELEGWISKTRLNRVYVGPNKMKELEIKYAPRGKASKPNVPDPSSRERKNVTTRK